MKSDITGSEILFKLADLKSDICALESNENITLDVAYDNLTLAFDFIAKALSDLDKK